MSNEQKLYLEWASRFVVLLGWAILFATLLVLASITFARANEPRPLCPTDPSCPVACLDNRRCIVEPVPTLSLPAIIASVALVGGVGLWVLRRRHNNESAPKG